MLSLERALKSLFNELTLKSGPIPFEKALI